MSIHLDSVEAYDGNKHGNTFGRAVSALRQMDGVPTAWLCGHLSIAGIKPHHSVLVVSRALKFDWKLWQCCNCHSYLYVTHSAKPELVLVNAALKVSAAGAARCRRRRSLTCARCRRAFGAPPRCCLLRAAPPPPPPPQEPPAVPPADVSPVFDIVLKMQDVVPNVLLGECVVPRWRSRGVDSRALAPRNTEAPDDPEQLAVYNRLQSTVGA